MLCSLFAATEIVVTTENHECCVHCLLCDRCKDGEPRVLCLPISACTVTSDNLSVSHDTECQLDLGATAVVVAPVDGLDHDAPARIVVPVEVQTGARALTNGLQTNSCMIRG